jgi:hypothetical protein
MTTDVFTPIGATVNIATVGTTSTRVQRTLSGQGGDEIRVANTGTAVAFVEFGASTIDATVTASLPILPGAVEVFSVNPMQTHVAAITASGTTTLYISTGRGA